MSCNVDVLRRAFVGHCRSRTHRQHIKLEQTALPGVETVTSAFKSRIVTYKLTSDKDHITIPDFLDELNSKFVYLIRQLLGKHITIKVNLEFFGLYAIFSKNNLDVKSFNTKNIIVSQSTNLEELYDQFKIIILRKASEFQERDSGNKLV